MFPQKYLKYKPVYLAKGKRSIVYVFSKNNKKYFIKIKHPNSKAQNRLENEATFLKILNKYKIGPKLIGYRKDFIVMEYIWGVQLIKYNKKNKDQIFVNNILEQCFILDKLKINKEEMHKPLKHIFISKNKITMIDFERCHYTDKPKNVTQFVQFIQRMFHIENEKLKSLLRLYKHEQTKENLDSIRKEIEKAIKQS